MKLHHSPASPFARKVRVTAIECGLADKLELLATNPHESTPALVAANPLSKVPALELDNGEVIYESLLICEYLDDMTGGGVVLPKDRAKRFEVLRRHAIGNGLTEVSVLRRVEALRAQEADRDKNLARQVTITERVLDQLEARASSLGDAADLGNLSIAIALDYLDFRFRDDAWRDKRPALARWHASYSKRPSLQATIPG